MPVRSRVPAGPWRGRSPACRRCRCPRRWPPRSRPAGPPRWLSAAISRVVTKPATSRLTTMQVLPIRSANSARAGQGLVRGLVAAHQLAQRHHRHRREEVGADHRLRTPGGRRQLADRDRRGVGGQHRGVLAEPVQGGEDAVLDVEALEHRLDDEVGLGRRAQVGAEGDPVQRGLHVVLGQPALGDEPGQRLLDAVLAAVQGHLGDVGQHHRQRRRPRPPERSPTPSGRHRRSLPAVSCVTLSPAKSGRGRLRAGARRGAPPRASGASCWQGDDRLAWASTSASWYGRPASWRC